MGVTRTSLTHPTRAVLAVLFATLVALSAACSNGGGDAITVGDPYVKAMPAGEMSAAFATLSNNTSSDIQVTAASSDAAEKTELHEMAMDGSAMVMREVESITIPANGSVQLEPGGLHVMLIGLTEALEPGAEITIILTLSTGDDITVTAVARDMPNAQESYHP